MKSLEDPTVAVNLDGASVVVNMESITLVTINTYSSSNLNARIPAAGWMCCRGVCAQGSMFIIDAQNCTLVIEYSCLRK